MKKVFAIAFLLVLIVSAMAVAQDAQAPWTIYMKADSGAGSNFMAQATIAVGATAKDGFGTDGVAVESGNDSTVASWIVGDGSRGVYSVQGNNLAGTGASRKLLLKDTKSTRSPYNAYYDAGMASLNGAVSGTTPNYEKNKKIWDLRVFASPLTAVDTEGNPLPDPAGNVIRLRFLTDSATTLPVATVKDKTNVSVRVGYRLRMVDNMGVEGAPANGTFWVVPIPTVHSTNAYFSITLPALYLSDKTNNVAISEGYKMQFYQTPEPSSILALGAGLMGLAGFASRRRRS